MTWAKIETGYLANQKVVRLSAPATLLHLASILWSHDRRPGWVPEHVIPLLCAHAWSQPPTPRCCTSSLVGYGRPVLRSYWVHDFLRHQDTPSRQGRENERERGYRERQRKRRESQVSNVPSRRDIGYCVSHATVEEK
jgi:hypothetical protein